MTLIDAILIHASALALFFLSPIQKIIELYPNRGPGVSENALFMRMKNTVLHLAGLSQIVDESPVCISKIKQDIDQALNQTSNRRLSVINAGETHPNIKRRVSKGSVFNGAGSAPQIDHSKDPKQLPEERGLSKTY